MNKIVFESRIGGRSENQDFFNSFRTKEEELIIVCDGMGGHPGGRFASELAINTIIEEIDHIGFFNSVEILKKAIEKANLKIWEKAKSDPEFRNMGTTLVALLITPKNAVSFHVGDSRLYQFRQGEILHRTIDHSLVFELVNAGIIKEEEARLSPQSNIITRALGINPFVDIEITDNLTYQKGDRFLLCTDGVWGAFPNSILINLINKKGNLKRIIKELFDKIDMLGIEKGGNYDNFTATIIEII